MSGLRLLSRTPHRGIRRLGIPLRGIEVPSPFDIDKFCANVATHRGRSIHVEAVDGFSSGKQEMCGLWIALDDSDYIFYEASTSPLHRVHIVLHEIGHMLLGHRSSMGQGAAASLSGIFSGIDPSTVHSMLARADFATPQERDAERLANHIARLAELPAAPHTRPAELHRIDAALRSE